VSTGRRRTGRRSRTAIALLLATAATGTAVAGGQPAADAAPTAQAVAPGFAVSTVGAGLTYPTNVEVAGDGRVFVTEKSGRVVAMDDLDDETPDEVIDLGGSIHNYEDRGLLGLEVDPDFPDEPYIYLLYTLDRDDSWNDDCPNPPGTFDDGCVVDGRLARLEIDEGNGVVGDEQVLLEDVWCAQYPSHTVGDLEFAPDGALLVSAGDGADYNSVDFGQNGGDPDSPTPANPCDDPPGGAGTPLTPPTAEGGALRSQDLLTPDDPMTLDGSVLRLDPDTGEAMPDNPLAGGTATDDDRVLAHGLRNPFRITSRPDTDEVWVGDVGWGTWEEINRIESASDDVVENFGWPCYEGAEPQSTYAGVGLDLCQGLYDGTAATELRAPHFQYRHGNPPDPDRCGTQPGGSITALEFYAGGAYPATYDGALFFGDYTRGCIWAMMPGVDGLPDTSQVVTMVTGAYPVDLVVAPGGDLLWLDILEGTLNRIEHFGDDLPPSANITVDRDNGPLPLQVQLDGSGSTAGDDGALSYAWDLDGDGDHDDSTDPVAAVTYTAAGPVTVRLRVTNAAGLSHATSVVVHAGNSRPVPAIDAPAADATWSVDQVLALAGSATDAEDGALGGAALSWQANLHHCSTPDDCHVHLLQTFAGQATPTMIAPNHEYPAYLELELTATDAGGLTGTTALRLDPATHDLTVESEPAGVDLSVGSRTATAPFTQTVIADSYHTVSAPSPQTLGDATFRFGQWSDGGSPVHQITVTEPATLTATYTADPAAPVTHYVSDLPWVSETNGYGPAERDMANGQPAAGDGPVLSVGGQTWAKGVGAHANSEIVLDLPPECTRFDAGVGIDDGVGNNGTVQFSVLGDGDELATSPVLTGADPSHVLTADLTGVSQLTLVTDDTGDNNWWDHADWGDALLTCEPPPAEAETVYLSDLPWVGESNGYGPAERDMANGEPAAGDGPVISIGGQTFAKGIGAHADGEIVVDVPPDCTRFDAVVGVDDGVGLNGTVRFTVTGDGDELATSPVLAGGAPGHALTADVTDIAQLGLGVDHAGDNPWWDHASWGDARLLCGGEPGPDDPDDPPPGPGGFGAPVSLPTGDRSHSVVARDLDGDADLDLVTAAAGADAAVVLLNAGDGTYAPAVAYPTGPGTFPKHIEVGDVTGDGAVDLVSANQDSTDGTDVTVFAGVGDGTFAPGTAYGACERPHQTVLGDIDGDDDEDVVVACWGGGVVSVLRNDGAGVLGAPEDIPAAWAPHSLVLRDFDGDADLDLATAALGDNRLAVSLNAGDGTYGAPTLLWSGLGPHNVVSDDLDGDGFWDLVVTSQGQDLVGVLLGHGDGTFGDATFFPVGSVPKATSIGDVDGDGLADLVTANTHGNYPDGSAQTSLTVLLGEGDGTFAAGFDLANDLSPFSVAIADLDGDGGNEIATANWHSDDIKLWTRAATG